MVIPCIRMTYYSLYIVTTDRYGKSFFGRLIERIKHKYNYPNKKYYIFSTRGDGGLNKISKIIDTGLIKHEVVVIFVDGDKNKENVERKLRNKISEHPNKDKVEFITFESEVEEWVLKGTGKTFNPRNKASTQILDYKNKKYKLTGYASKIDLDALREKDMNFRRFVEILDP